MIRVERLELLLESRQDIGVEELAELGVTEQLAKLRVIDRQRLRAAFRQRRVAVIQERGDVVEQQRRRKWRRLRRVDRDDADLATRHARQRIAQRRHVEDVAQALPIGLEHRGERPESRRHGEEIGGALALLPERGARARPPPRKQQRPSRDLPELRGEQCARSQLPHHERLDLVGRRQEQGRVWRLVRIGDAHDEPVVAPHRLDVDAALAAETGDDGKAPRNQDATAERREHAHAPVAELVAAPLDDDGAVVGNGAGGVALIGEVLQKVRTPPCGRDRVGARGGRWLAPVEAPRVRVRASRLPCPAPAAGRPCRPSRTASFRARPAPRTPSPDRA